MPEQPDIRLAPPGMGLLPSYTAALERGWSPIIGRDVSRQQLLALRVDPEAFLDALVRQGGLVTVGDRAVPRLPFRLFWISDGEFAGTIRLRFQHGTEDLPAHVSGHIGFHVVPWKRRRGYATRALALMLPVARAEGLRRVLLTCDDDNVPSRKAIEANGGIFAGTRPNYHAGGKPKLLFWISL